MRFKSKLVRRLASAAYICRTLLVLGVATFTPCIAIKTVIGIPYYVSIIGMILVSILFMLSVSWRSRSSIRRYVVSLINLYAAFFLLKILKICSTFNFQGGFSSALMGDVVQGILMILVCLIVIVKGTIEAGGPWNVIKLSHEKRRLDFFK